jgi:hypothetical protein
MKLSQGSAIEAVAGKEAYMHEVCSLKNTFLGSNIQFDDGGVVVYIKNWPIPREIVLQGDTDVSTCRCERGMRLALTSTASYS